MKKYTIKDLSEGNCSVENDGTLEELQRVIKTAFPEAKVVPTGDNRYYYSIGDDWDCRDYINLPSQSASVKEFIKELDASEWVPEVGEMVLVSDDPICDKTTSPERAYIATSPKGKFITANDSSRFSDGRDFIVYQWNYMKRIQSPKKVTMKEVCDKFGEEVEIIRE